MKATELKINDWVLAGGEPVQMQDVCVENSTLTVYNDKTNKIEEYRYNELIPTPLTSEILEKNGWENDNKDEDLWFIMYALGKLCIEFHEWKDCGMLALVSVRNGDDEVPLLHIKHIHELQHLLWALGMDDDLKI